MPEKITYGLAIKRQSERTDVTSPLAVAGSNALLNYEHVSVIDKIKNKNFV